MARRYRIVAEVEGGPPEVGDRFTHNGERRKHASLFVGTITEVTPILSAEEALDQIEEDMEKDFLSYEEHFRRAKETIARHRASQEKPLCSTCHRPAHPDAPEAC